MKNLFRTMLIAVIATLCLTPMLKQTNAQGAVNSNTAQATVNLTIPESITVSVTGGPIVISPSTGIGSSVNVTASWTIQSGHTTATLYSWFSSASAAISNSSPVPATNFQAQTNGGPFNGCSQTVSFSGAVAGAACQPFVYTNNPATDLNEGGVTVPFVLKMMSFAGLSAGSYTGTMNFAVQIV